MSESDLARHAAVARGRRDGYATVVLVALCSIVAVPASGGRLLEYPLAPSATAAGALLLGLAALAFRHRRAGRHNEATAVWRGGAAAAVVVLCLFGGLHRCSDVMSSLPAWAWH